MKLIVAAVASVLLTAVTPLPPVVISSLSPVGQFPQLAIQPISGSQNFPPANDSLLASFGLAIIGGNFNQWPGLGRTRDQLVVSLQNQTPHIGKHAFSTIVFQYENAYEMNPAAPWFPDWTNMVTANNWSLYQSGASGTKTQSVWVSTWTLVDMAHVVAKDSSGFYPYEELANLLYKRYYLGTDSAGPSMASTHINGYFVDNYSPYTLVGSPGDWLRNGASASAKDTDPTVTSVVSIGKADYPLQMAKLNPNIIVGANTAFGYALTSTSIGGKGMTSSPLTGMLGMAMEQFLWATAKGSEPGVLTWGGFSTAMARYIVDEASIKPGGFVVETGGVLASDYQLVRYSLGMMLMRNGWATYAIQASGTDVIDPSVLAQYPSFDEFWGGSLNQAGYLGAASATAQGAEQSTPWLQGVWRRDFVNGIALVNPNTNSAQTVALGGTFCHLKGSQSVNSGQQVTSVTVPSADGVILLRKCG